MKMARKVLSVVLAVLMALSCFAVAASAWGNENSERTVKVSLGLSKGSVEWGKDNKGKVTVETDDPADAEIIDGNNIYAKKGEIVWVYVTLETNYYVWSFGNQVFFSAALIDADTDMKNSGVSTVNMTTAVEPLIHQWNVDNELYASYGSTLATQAPWGKMSATNKKDYKKAWPTDDDLKVVSGYGSGTTPDQDTWHWNRNAITITGSSDCGVISDGSTWLYRFPLRVPSTATDGTKYTITIPEGMIKRAAKSTSVMLCSEMGEEGVVDGTNELKAVWSYPENANSLEQYWDLSDATVTITVGEEPAAVDYTALNAAITQFEGLTEADYTADSWAAAYAVYEAALDAKTATTQAAVDTAKTNLLDAIAALEEASKLDYTGINAAIAAAQAADTANATTSSAAALDAALDTALAAKEDATTQAELDNAAADLIDAINGLTDKADMTALEAAIADALAVDTTDWTADAIKDLDDAVAAGQAIVDQADDFSDQLAVNNAEQAIRDAMVGAIEVANYSAVFAAIDDAAAVNRELYTDDSLAALDAAINDVEGGLPKSQQTKVDGFAAAINAALENLEKKGADYSAVDAALANVPDEFEIWTDDSVDAVLAAVAAVERGKKIDEQADVDAMAEAINAALENLEKKDADYSAVENALDSIPGDLSIYTDDSVAAVINAVNAVEYGKKIDEQADVDAMAKAINDALANLDVKGADYEYVDKYVNQAAALNRDLYTADSLAALDSALAAVVRGLDITHQDEVTGMANDLYAALDALEMKGADYSAVETALAKVPADSSLYTTESWSALDAAINAVVYGKAVDEQADVNAMAAAIEAAIEGLVDAGADYSAIEALLANAPTANQTKSYKSKIDNSTYEFNYYTVDSYAAFDAAKNAVELGKLISQQGDVDAWAEALEIAINGLVPAGAETYVNYFEGKKDMNPDLYTAESWATYAAAKEEVLKYTVKDNWSKIGGGLSKANTGYDAAYMALTLKPVVEDADYTAFNATMAEAAEIYEDMTPYTSASANAFYAAYNDAQNVPADLTSDDQAIIDNATNALIAAINGLKAKADLTALNDAIAAAYDKEADEDLYTEESWDVLVEAVAVGEAFTNSEVELTAEDDQKAIDDAAAAILAAIAALEEKPVVVPADYDYLDAAIADAEAIIEAGQGNYTDATWNDLVNAVTAGKLLSRDLTSDDQIAVDDATSAIIDAKTALEIKGADYTELDALLAETGKINVDLYTDETVAPFVAAWGAANDLSRDLTADDQKTIDDAAAALAAAKEALKLKTAEDELGHVKEVTYTPSVDPHNTYEVRVEGRPSMIQFMDSHGGTRSFDRYNDKVVSIKHYDKDGNEVGELSRKIAYEVWTVETLLEEDTFTMRAKGNNETKWEPITGENGELYTFVNKYATPDAHFVSVTAPTSGKKGAVMINVVAEGDDIERIMVKNEGGDTVTGTLANGRIVKNADGTISGSLKGWASHDGENTITVKLYAGGKWVEEQTVVYTVGNVKPR